MEPLTSALASVAAQSVIDAATTAGWEAVRAKVARLFGRDRPDQGTEQRLEATYDQLVSARSQAELERAQATEAAHWQTRFADLLNDRPEAATGLAAILREIDATALPSNPAIDDYSKHVQAWIAERWPPDTECPMCRTVSGWELVEMANLKIREGLPGDIGRVLPVVPLTCKRCAYVVFLGAVRIGLLAGTSYPSPAVGNAR